MIKVVIADDEYKICELIYNLVEWEQLDMEVIAVAHDGKEALQILDQLQPDVMITDIRMPGCDGLELVKAGKERNTDIDFIIVSGYRQFDYAKQALQFGVTDYLLKPIKKNELLRALEKIQQRYYVKRREDSRQMEFQMLFQEKRTNQRKRFLDEILLSGKLSEELTEENINQFYRLHLNRDGIYQILLFKADGIRRDNKNEISYIYEKAQQILEFEIRDICYDMEGTVYGSSFLLLLNFEQQKEKEVRGICKKVLDRLLLQRDVIEALRITIGMSRCFSEIDQIGEAYKEAKWAVEQRVISGTNIIIDGSERKQGKFAYGKVFTQFTQRFEEAIELLNRQEILNTLFSLRELLEKDKTVSGYEILQISKAVMNLYILTMEKNGYEVEERERLFQDFNEEVEDFSSLDDITVFLTRKILRSFQKFCDEKKDDSIRPVRLAQKYVKEHIGETISLDKVSEQIGFNATYFSSMFKKETGMNFSEYVMRARVEKAKELLKNTEETVAGICGDVGYLDIKTFTKNFKKYTGLKPSEFRKIYS